ncbi:MAG TPA: ABC transporter ATP-binding protein [Gemmatimonadaceae bacterium]|nr:ABC transporter ATP-binding protein [Gemmatimonadaceae bacterium]
MTADDRGAPTPQDATRGAPGRMSPDAQDATPRTAPDPAALAAWDATTAVSCRGVVKRFYRYEHRTRSLRELFIRAVLRRPIHVRRAEFTLRGLDLAVHRGEAVALIGRNGSGKSTALRLIAGIYAPSEGVIATQGRLAAVIELGVGFHPDLTGRENVVMYAAVMGFTRAEIAARYDDIVEFAGIGNFIDEPVKYYSSGMQARLAFAVAACVRPDILLLDEVLAVGDQSFRERCLTRLREFLASEGTLIVVSHDLDSIRSLCTRAVWLDAGQVLMDGGVEEVLSAYEREMGGDGAGGGGGESSGAPGDAAAPVGEGAHAGGGGEDETRLSTDVTASAPTSTEIELPPT